jgi:hypothetical protein
MGAAIWKARLLAAPFVRVRVPSSGGTTTGRNNRLTPTCLLSFAIMTTAAA